MNATAYDQRIATAIGAENLAIIEKIYKLCPTIQLGGSISLYIYGITTRDIGDVDVVIEDKKVVHQMMLKTNCRVRWAYAESDEFQVNDTGDMGTPEHNEETATRARLQFITKDKDGKYQNHYVCAFFEQKSEFTTVALPFGLVRVQHPRYAIAAKRKYLQHLLDVQEKQPLTELQEKKYAKHLCDIITYEKTLIL